MRKEWYYLDSANQPQGPVDAAFVVRLARRREFFVWREGFAEWVAVSTLERELHEEERMVTQPLGLKRVEVGRGPVEDEDDDEGDQEEAAQPEAPRVKAPDSARLALAGAGAGALSGRSAMATVGMQHLTAESAPEADAEEGEGGDAPSPERIVEELKGGVVVEVIEPSDSDGAAWLDGPDGHRIYISEHWSIGRSPDNNHVIPGHKVSRRHALIHTQGGEERWLVDLGSSNGTYLNGRRITRPTRLKAGDLVRIPGVEYTFQHRVKSENRDATAINEVTVREFKTYPTWLLVTDIVGFAQMSQTTPGDQLAKTIGQWFSQSKQLVEFNSGTINKYFDNGYLAFWMDDDNAPHLLTRALEALRRLQVIREPAFRVVLHFGEVSFGGASASGDENLIGGDVNFAMRMQKLAGDIDADCLISEPAASRLAKVELACRPLGTHKVPGFVMDYEFYAVG